MRRLMIAALLCFSLTAQAAQVRIKSVSSNHSATKYDELILVNASGGTRTVTLPAASAAIGSAITVKKTDSSANAVVVSGDSIDGYGSSYNMTVQNASVELVSDGTKYQVIKDSGNQFVGSSYFAATGSCQWTRNSPTPAAPAPVTACPGPTIEAAFIGSWQTTDTDLPQQTINNLPAGLYGVKVSVLFAAIGASTAQGCISVSDGTTESGKACWTSDAGGVVQTTITTTGYFNYSAPGNRTFTIFLSGNGQELIYNTLQIGVRFWIERY